MMTPSPESIKTLQELNATYRFTFTGSTWIDNQVPGGNPVQDTKKPPKVFCEILDLTVVGAPPYARAEGVTKMDALEKALAIAVNAEKPMTPAQLADKAKLAAIVSNKDARIAELEAQLAAVGKTPVPAAASPVGESTAPSETPAPKKRGRPPGSINKAKSGGASVAKATGETIVPSLNVGEVAG